MEMSDGLAYFKNVYDDVPDWVQKMHDYHAEALGHYTALRSTIMKDGILTTKEKDLLLVGMNAARLYERSMVYHTKSAMSQGATIPELVEYLLIPYVYNGEEALKIAFKSLESALAFQDTAVTEDGSLEEILIRMIQLMRNEDTSFIEKMLESVRTGDPMFVENLFNEGMVSSKLKYILMAGIYTVELQGRAAGKWIDAGRDIGVSEEELVEMGLISMLTAGIPAWFEASDSLL